MKPIRADKIDGKSSVESHRRHLDKNFVRLSLIHFGKNACAILDMWAVGSVLVEMPK